MTFDWKQVVIGLMIVLVLGGCFLMVKPPGQDSSPVEVVQPKKTKKLILSFYNENKQIEKLEGVKVRVESESLGQPEQSNDQGQVELWVLASSKKIDVFYEKDGFKWGRRSIDLETQSGKTILIGLKPELDKVGAAISIEQFTLNKEVSPYFYSCSGKVNNKEVDVYGFTEVGAMLTSYLNQVTLNKLSLNGSKIDKVEILPEEIASLPAKIKRDQKIFLESGKSPLRFREWTKEGISKWNKELSELPTAIRQELEGDRLDKPSETLTGLEPTFDVTFINEGKKTLVLTGINLFSKFFGGGDTSAIAIPPLAVSYRYRVDVSKNKNEMPLTPPIEIPSNKALRIQVQLTDNDNGWYQVGYLLKLQFNFGGKISVSTKDFFLSGNEYGYRCSDGRGN